MTREIILHSKKDALPGVFFSHLHLAQHLAVEAGDYSLFQSAYVAL